MIYLGPLRLQGENKEGEDESLLLIGYVAPRSISSRSLQMYSSPRGLRGRGIKKGEERRGEAMASMREIHHGGGDKEEKER